MEGKICRKNKIGKEQVMAILAVQSGSPELVTDKEVLKKRPNGKNSFVKMTKWKNSIAKNPTGRKVM